MKKSPHPKTLIEKIEVVESVNVSIPELNEDSLEDIEIVESVDIYLLELNRQVADYPKVKEFIKITFETLVDVLMRPEIHIDVEFDLTDNELMFMEGLVGDKAEQRRHKVGRFYFAMNYTMRDIAKTLGISKSQVSRHVEQIRFDMIKVIKKDLRANKKILGHMIDLIYQIEHQTNVIWEKYSQLEADSSVLRAGLREAYDLRRRDPTAPITNMQALASASRAVLAIHRIQQGYLSLLSQQTKRMLEVWDKFGLCGEDAINVIMSGGIDVEAQVQEVRTTIVKLVSIVKAEVKDQNQTKRIFSRMVQEIKVDGFTRSDIANPASSSYE